MIKTSLTSLFLISSLLGFTAQAHEGHDVPGQIKALHGGITKPGKIMHMEMLVTENNVQLFPLAHEGEELKVSEVKITGTAKTPKGKPQNLTFTSDGKAFSTQVDLQGSYRANLEIKATYGGKIDNFKFIVEK